MANIKIACETYAWQMPGEQYKGKLPHIMQVVSKAGFAGIEPETSFFGSLTDPGLMKECLAKHNLELAVLCHVEDWRNPRETDTERVNANRWMEFLAQFPDTIYLLVQMPGSDRSHLIERQQNLLKCVNSIAARAHDNGIVCSYHPNSPEGSVYRTREDYNILLEGLKSDYIGYTPDVGHIAKVDMDPLSIIKEYRSLVNLVHYKDMFSDGRWAPTGEGVIDFSGITSYLIDSGFEGWIVMEDECDEAITNPDGVTLEDGNYIDKKLRPLLSK
ncbi:MAG: inosose dehydratase [Cyclobacteriaceae bacterium]|nr:MAG: inosose dehydratase [Cyclobacteriaceae bacterium]